MMQYNSNLGVWKYLFLTLCFLFLNEKPSTAQKTITLKNCNSGDGIYKFRAFLADIIDEHDVIDTSKSLSIVFSIKIDASGEALSAHISKSQNLECSAERKICRLVEKEFNFKLFHELYVCWYPFSQNWKYVTMAIPSGPIYYTKKTP